MSALIDEWRRLHRRSGAEAPPIAEEDRERLRAMGYAE